MATCSKCRAEMGQTEAVCPKCGFDFPAPPPPGILWGLFERQSSLRGWLYVTGVLTIPLAFIHYIGRNPHRGVTGFGLFMCSLLCAWLLRSDTHWSTIFEALALFFLITMCLF